MEMSKFVLLCFLMFSFVACGREKEPEVESALPVRYTIKDINTIPDNISLNITKDNISIFYEDNGLKEAEFFDSGWHYFSVTESVGEVKNGWSSGSCGNENILVVQGEDNKLYLVTEIKGGFSKMQIDLMKFGTEGAQTDIQCLGDERYIVAYDPLTGALYYFSGKDTFKREKITEGGENGLYPEIRVTSFGRVYIAFMDGSTSDVIVAYKDPGKEWVTEDTGVKGDRFSFEISYEGADLAGIYPRLAVRSLNKKGFYWVEKGSHQWKNSFVSINGFLATPLIFVSSEQVGVLYQNTAWNDLEISLYDGYSWKNEKVVTGGATGFTPAIKVYGEKLFIAFYDLTDKTLVISEVKLPWR